MLDIQLLRNDLEGTAERLKARGYALDVRHFQELEQERKGVQMRTQELQAKRNQSSKQIGIAKSKGEDVSATMAEIANVGDELKATEEKLAYIQNHLNDLLMTIPNLPHESVPAGKSTDDNVEVRRWGAPPKFDFVTIIKTFLSC